MIGAKIKEAREGKGWPQRRLAIALGVTETTVRNWESGRTTPNFLKIEALEATLSVSLE